MPMPSASSAQAAQEPFIPVMRELARAYQAFSAYSDAHVRQFDLTPAQFDVIATLGNTQGMTMGDIGEKTLITKGTLTGVVDRLVQKQLVQRETPADNRRSVVVQLTTAGQAVFEQVFPAHIAHVKERFEQLSPAELETLRVLLERLRRVF
ncbi:MarR family transcriptional regulator [Nodosilinea sp. LEGE 06152]|uniref:MarR family winged helix-turn-helix transcriptional regulator n=1 Tax=Nodosilinea sp. LEGE 06152 TaxID=2777966 RepID=UPI00187EB08D|nr:MarR family transcriptional regulator [Nodosilinea sp. LEGE 06152]MBE9159389.1 MarR family transcriptional regulator [Nodosilinea sp. LEGE 06152]